MLRGMRSVLDFLPQGLSLTEDVWRARHTWFVRFLWLHGLGVGAFAAIQGYTFGESLAFAAVLSAFALLGGMEVGGRRFRASVISFGYALASGLLVHLSGGYIELHFHYFVMVSFLVLYQDWVPFLISIGFVGLQHGLLGALMPHSVFNHPDAIAHPWKWASIHAIFLSAAALGCILAWRTIERTVEQLERALREQRQADEAVKANEERYRSVIESVNDAIISADSMGNIRFWNKGARVLFGYEEREVLGKPLTLLMPERYRNAHLGGLERMRNSGESHVIGKTVALHGLKKDAREFPLELSLSAWKTNGTLAYTGVIRDITERKKAEETKLAKLSAERANQAKSEFLSRMSHELRTPLNAVLGFAQFLEMDALSPEQQEHVQHILKGGRHLLTLINEVLDIARIEAGRMTLSLEPVSVSAVINEAVELIQPQAAARNIRLTVPSPQEQPVHVRADRQRLKQVLLNLLSNGVKYNREGGTLTVSCEATPDRRYRLTITDTGGGIPAAMMSRLFTPFDRLEADARTEGTGLGLVLSRSLTTGMGGTLSVDSVEGRGTSVSVELPVSDPPAARAASAPAMIPVAAPVSGGAFTILYIEDNLSNYQLLEHLVTKRPGVKLLGAMQGKLGVELAVSHRPDLILLDLNLPDIQGDEVLLRLRERAETATIPVIMLSADAIQRQVDRLLASGARGYLTKPIEVAQFYALLDEFMAKKGG